MTSQTAFVLLVAVPLARPRPLHCGCAAVPSRAPPLSWRLKARPPSGVTISATAGAQDETAAKAPLSGASMSGATSDATSTAATAVEPSSAKYDLGQDEIAVRFINTPMGYDVVAAAKPGDPLLGVSDSVGICIPRACQSGLCGTCTCDVLDNTAESGRQTIRACQAGVVIPDNNTELVVDVARMKTARAGKDPMARFENLDTGYVAGAAPSGSGSVLTACPECKGSGRVLCYNCDGAGVETIDDNNQTDDVAVGAKYTCLLCVGMKSLRCSTCQGTSQVNQRR